jgi:hypothetical protein
MRLKSFGYFLVLGFIAYDHSIGFEFDGLTYEKFRTVVGGKELDLEQVPVLTYHVQGLASYGSGGSQYGYAPFLHGGWFRSLYIWSG